MIIPIYVPILAFKQTYFPSIPPKFVAYGTEKRFKAGPS